MALQLSFMNCSIHSKTQRACCGGSPAFPVLALLLSQRLLLGLQLLPGSHQLLLLGGCALRRALPRLLQLLEAPLHRRQRLLGLPQRLLVRRLHTS